ncbi:MAG: alpha/beta hydrolase fold protein [Panacagrimonas sp.]|jgi:pimeloyl-ACP methyl ester carboxylesterase|nr:alpha/beta hydrolase [Panacagrimonas sp.]MCC2658738.1 alpha/beta hydrolase fold protein [Panacagrimonas sp.]
MNQTVEPLDFELPSGRIHAERRGAADQPLTLCVHGLSANLRGFDAIAPVLAGQVVVPDLRGRGRSPDSGPGSYGIDSHVADVLAIADRLGAERFDLVGWSLGALIGMRVALRAGSRLRRLVLLDHAGHMDPSAVDVIRAGLARLDAVVPSPEAYVAAIRRAGVIDPWTDFWTRFYTYELARREDGAWSPSTSRAATEEELLRGAPEIEGFVASTWPALTMPTLLVRALKPMAGGLIVPEAVRDAFVLRLPRLSVVETPANHYTMVEDPITVGAVQQFLERA